MLKALNNNRQSAAENTEGYSNSNSNSLSCRAIEADEIFDFLLFMVKLFLPTYSNKNCPA